MSKQLVLLVVVVLLTLTPARSQTRQAIDPLERTVIRLYEADQHEAALPLAQKLVTLCEATFGPEHDRTITSLYRLGNVYYRMGEYDDAAPIFSRILAIREKTHGPDAPTTAVALDRVGELYIYLSRYEEAEKFLQRALAIDEHHDSDHAAVAMNNLATLYKTIGDHPRARALYERSLKMREERYGADDPKTATALASYASFLTVVGDYAHAAPLLRRAALIRKQRYGEKSPEFGATLVKLGILYSLMLDYERAEPILMQALKIDEAVAGEDDPATAAVLEAVAEHHRRRGAFKKAIPFYTRALAIREELGGPDAMPTSETLNDMALAYKGLHDYARAEAMMLRALHIREKLLKPDHYLIANNLENLADIYAASGDLKRAEPIMQRALEIFEKALGPNHARTGRCMRELALLEMDLGKAEAAQPLARRSAASDEAVLANVLTNTTQQQRLQFESRTHYYELLATLGMADDLAQRVLRCKGVVLDSLLEDDRKTAQAASDPRKAAIIQQLRALQATIAQKSLQVPKQGAADHDRELLALRRKADQLQWSLSSGQAEQGHSALTTTVADVQRALPGGTALVEFLLYRHYLGNDKTQFRYGAIVIAPSGPPQWIPLGPAQPVEAAVAAYKDLARGLRTRGARRIDVPPAESTDEVAARTLHALEQLIWAPVARALPADTKTVLLCPDGTLSFVSFATLLGDDDHFEGERLEFRYVASGRDVLRPATPAPGREVVLLGSADFDGGQPPAAAPQELARPELRDLHFEALPGTAVECDALRQLATASRCTVTLLTGTGATETALRAIRSPHVLHLATHGYFLAATKNAAASDATTIENPMLRCGIALCGSNRTVDAWKRGDAPPTETDGILTADEVGALQLTGTWLVVLSACETGVGEARRGEGVMGLRRGFIQAGALNLLMTLWPVADEETAAFMQDFYRLALRTNNAQKALAETQRAWLIRLRAQKGLAAAVRLAGPFIMTSQGKP